ncbi:MAG: hypothetical protein LBQ67_01385 [Treponema sp.]|nr:hypothetical protein [Treponema sp.]
MLDTRYGYKIRYGRALSEFFVELVKSKSFLEEKEIMPGYYSGFEFDSPEEVYERFNSSEYLKKHPNLKETVIKNALGENT